MTALKTTSLRLRGTDVSVLEEEGLDSEGAVTSKSKLQSKVKALSGVDILTATGEYKSTYEILSQIADVWESINDMDQAALLELISGKRNSSVIAAILQNPEELKAAFEDANNAQGSALKENEKYLDSIQGKIDQFNNAVQSLWSNILNADLVKGIVGWVTKIIKSLDTTRGKILAIVKAVAILMAYKKVNPLDWATKFVDITNKIHTDGLKQYIASLFQVSAAQKTVTADTLVSTIAQEQNDIATQNQIISKLGLTNVTGALTAAQKAQAAQELVTLFNGGKISEDLATRIAAMLGYKFSVDSANQATVALDTTTKAFMASNPIGWILLAVSAVGMLVTVISMVPSELEKTTEKLSDLRSEISDTESQIDSLNSELTTTADRIAELQSMPHLSFVEQEELNKLIQYNDELERNKKIQQGYLKSQQDVYNKNKATYINQVWHSQSQDKAYAYDTTGIIVKDDWKKVGGDTKFLLDRAINAYEERARAQEAKDAILLGTSDINFDDGIDFDEYKQLYLASYGFDNATEGGFKLDKTKTKEDWMSEIQNSERDFTQEMADIAQGINMVLGDEEFEDLTYGMSDNINAFLDEYYAYQLKWQSAQGAYVKSDAISSMFNSTSTKELQELGNELQKIADSDLTDEQKNEKILEQLDGIDGTIGDGVKKIDGATDAYNRLHLAMDIVGVTAQDISDYFILDSGVFDSNTVEGITKQYQTGVDVLQKYKEDANAILGTWKNNTTGEIENITWDSLFKDGEVVKTQIAKILQGADQTAQDEFARLIKTVDENTMSLDDAISSFGLSGALAGFKLIEESIKTLNTDVFKNLGDDISGLIDTFEELGSVLDSVASSMDLISQAEAEQAYSGNVSLETALKLMQTTEDWNKILTITEGQISVNEDATENLVKDQLNLVVANLKTSLSTVSAQIAQNNMAASSDNLGKTIEESTTESVRQLAANMEYLGSIVGDFISGNWGKDADGNTMAQRAAKAKSASLESTRVAETPKSTVDLGSQQANLVAQLQMMGITATIDENGNVTYDGEVDWEKIMGGYSADDASGGNDSLEDVAADAFQKEMDYWENRIAANQAKYEQLQNEIDLLETKGQKASRGYYDEQLDLIEAKRILLEGENGKGGQKGAALAYLEELEAAGKEGSEEWWEVAETLNSIEAELDDVTASIVDLQDAIGEIDTYKFEEFNTRLDNLISKLDTLRNLMTPDGEEDWFDEQGNWTEDGVAVLGSYIQELELYNQGLKETEETMTAFNAIGNGTTWKDLSDAQRKEYADKFGIHSEQEYYDKTEELISQQYDYAESISDTQQSIVDMYESSIDAVEEYTETLIEGYSDYIDNVKEALDAERDLYDFKKNVQKQAKDIAEMERRLSSLSGSTNASDIAERRKLEAQLYEARESLNDTYYDHAKDSQDEALDNEQTAYEESMTKFVEGLRISLEEATRNMDEFLMGVTSMVMYNADTVLAKYEETNLPLNEALTNPWEEAKKAVSSYSGDALDLMSRWTKEGGFFAQFNETGTINLESPWSAGTTAAKNFGTDVGKVMSDVKTNIAQNVQTASGELSKLYQQIEDTSKKANSINNTTANPYEPATPAKSPTSTYNATATYFAGSKTIQASSASGTEADARQGAINSVLDKVRKYYMEEVGWSELQVEKAYNRWKQNIAVTVSKYAKGTLGTTRDGLAITDESWIGEEITLAAGKNGQLQYLKKGSAVMPADISANLVEWGKIDPSMLNLTNPASNINMITNAVNKPEINLSFEALVKAERIDEGTLPEVKRFVQQEINSLVKQMNYAIKGKGGR